MLEGIDPGAIVLLPLFAGLIAGVFYLGVCGVEKLCQRG